MTKSTKDSQTSSNNESKICPNCNAKLDTTYGDDINYCGQCGGVVSTEEFARILFKTYLIARDYPGLVLIINDDIRNILNAYSENCGYKKLSDPRDVLPILAKRYNLDISSSKQEVNTASAVSSKTDESYLAQIAKELHEINMKLGGNLPSPEMNCMNKEVSAPQKRGRGRPKKNTSLSNDNL